MPKMSAGILLFRRTNNQTEVLLVHPGGPFWAAKDIGVWSVPKGLCDEGEELPHAAKREFAEELGSPAPEGPLLELGHVKYGNKKVYVWAIEADMDVATIYSNQTTMEWPPHSGKTIIFPECDKAAWMGLAEAKEKIVKGQGSFIDRLATNVR